MTDEEILNELFGIKKHWEDRIEDARNKMESYQMELNKTNRLIAVLQEKIK